MSCNTKNDNACADRKISKEVIEMGAKDFCKEVEQVKKSVMGDLMDGIKALSPVAAIDSVTEIFKAKTNTSQDTKNLIKNLQQISSVSESVNTCVNEITSSQSNSLIIRNSPECIKAYTDAGLKPPKAVLTGVTQSNEAMIENHCVIEAIMDIANTSEISVDNQALIESIQEAVGMGSSSSSEQKNCNVIHNETDICTYLSSKQCCNNSIQVTQQNELLIDCYDVNLVDHIQKNVSKMTNSCVMSASTGLSSGLITDVLNAVEQKAEGSSEGFQLGIGTLIAAVIIGIVVLVGIPIGGTMVMGNSILTYMIPILGVGVFVTGMIFLIIGVTTKKYKNKSFIPINNRKNNPLFCQKGSSISELESMKYGEAKNIYDKDATIIGMDWLYSNKPLLGVDTPVLSNDQNGSVIFIKDIDTPVSETKCSNLKNDDKSVSFMKATKISVENDVNRSSYIILGTILMILALLVIAVNVIMQGGKQGGKPGGKQGGKSGQKDSKKVQKGSKRW